MFKKVIFFIGIALTILCAFTATAVQLIPFILVLILMGIQIYGKKDLRLWILIISGLMLFINVFAVFSLPDIIYWVLVVIAFWRK